MFKFQTEFIREQSTGESEGFVQEMIVDFMEMLKQVADEHLTCPKCNKVYKFRVCTGLSHEHDNAIELTCEGCGDCFSHSEKSNYLCYFNCHAWREVDECRRRSRGFTVTFTLGGLREKAAIVFYDDVSKRPELLINGRRVFNPAEVRGYWEHSKLIFKQLRNGERVNLKSYRAGQETFYRLEEESA